ncbi:hypothetical protein V2J09_014749 [Rumex salicifolius]
MKLHVLIVLAIISCVIPSEARFVPITYATSGVAKGAVCLDGSPPAYHFDKGFDSGVNNWLIHVEVFYFCNGSDTHQIRLVRPHTRMGGAWCDSAAACLAKRNTYLGSSTKFTTQYTFSGILSNAKKYNPDFFNWNRVKIRYCDGSSFTGDVEAVDPNTKLHYRGARVWNSIMDELMAKGMKNAKTALLSGCSAGGLTAILHCDSFSNMLPSANVKCFSDAGYFINGTDVSGGSTIEKVFSGVVATHASAKNLPASCTSKYNPSKCFFPQYAAQGIKTPLFLLNAAYDSWQIKNILAPGVADKKKTLKGCKTDISQCTSSQFEKLEGFRKEFLNALNVGGKPASRGLFINSCYCHCQSGTQETWLRDDSPVLDGTQIWKAVGDWFFERNSVQKVEQCAYPCDKTCHNRVFE